MKAEMVVIDIEQESLKKKLAFKKAEVEGIRAMFDAKSDYDDLVKERTLRQNTSFSQHQKKLAVQLAALQTNSYAVLTEMMAKRNLPRDDADQLT